MKKNGSSRVSVLAFMLVAACGGSGTTAGVSTPPPPPPPPPPVVNGSATLRWDAPTEYETGMPLNDLAGYKFYWGTTPGTYPNVEVVNNPGISTYVVDNLAPGTYEFVATAFNSSGVESGFSNAVTKTVP